MTVNYKVTRAIRHFTIYVSALGSFWAFREGNMLLLVFCVGMILASGVMDISSAIRESKKS